MILNDPKMNDPGTCVPHNGQGSASIHTSLSFHYIISIAREAKQGREKENPKQWTKNFPSSKHPMQRKRGKIRERKNKTVFTVSPVFSHTFPQ